MRIALLGGSTPFVTPLFAELARRVDPASLILHGRNEIALAAVGRYAQLALPGWSVSWTGSMPEALDGADLVVHQIRYGDLAGRGADERFAAGLGAAADETLGPGAFRSALRAAPPLRMVIEQIQQSCPGAFVVNLTNPLSVTTALFAAQGVSVIGLCELPEATVETASRVVGEPLIWSYTGLNHRGFVHDLEIVGRPGSGAEVIDTLREQLVDRDLLGVLGVEIGELNALPLKYFGLFADHAPHGAGRAEVLLRMRADALAELAADPAAPPPSIRGRSMPWWPLTVGPVLGAICTGEALDTVVNVPDEDGIVRERRAVVAGPAWRVLPTLPPPAAVTPWLDRFERHERAVLAALEDPSEASIREACRADPALPEASIGEAVRRLLADRPSD
jgi:6-phospho-beta-glucosidase